MSQNFDFTKTGRYISHIYRLMKRFYDIGLDGTGIGWGQQFYLEYIFENPGISPQDITERFKVDKGTVTKVLKKLVSENYIDVTTDENDRRMRHIYAKESALPVVRRIRELHSGLHRVITMNLPPEQVSATENNLDLIRGYLAEALTKMKEDNHE